MYLYVHIFLEKVLWISSYSQNGLALVLVLEIPVINSHGVRFTKEEM